MNWNPGQASSKTIFIIEDNDLNMKLFCDLLHADGYETIQSSDGKKVLEIAHERRPDLIIMDIQLPNRSGLDLTKLLKSDEHLTHIPIVAVTAYAMKGDRRKILDAGCDDYIAKPILIPEFLETIARHMS